MKAPGRLDITFFMLVTDSDAVIADYCIRSYRCLKKSPLRFQLVVYGNCLSRENEARYYPRWGRYDYVVLMNNAKHVSDSYPVAGRTIMSPEGIPRTIEGPWEMGATIWTRELAQFDTPFVATVDSDFELFDSAFVMHAYHRLCSDPKLAGVSSDFSPDDEHFFNSYWNTQHFLHKRWHTWFCIYRRTCLLQEGTSHYLYCYRDSDDRLKVYDDGGLLQHRLLGKGWKFEVLPPTFSTQYLHYGAFAKNTKITSKNAKMYRCFRVWMHRGVLPGLGFTGFRGRLNRWCGYGIHELFMRRFGGVDRGRQHFNYMFRGDEEKGE